MKTKNIVLLTSFLSALVLLGSTRATAALVISYGDDVDLVEGQTGSLDVSIRSDTADFDLLSIYSAKFTLTPVAGSGLVFADPPGDAQYTDPNYIFAGTDFDGLSSVVISSETLIAGDGTTGPDGFVVVPTTDRLLIRLDLDASAATVGSEFRVSLVNDPDTVFLDDGLTTPLSIASSSFSNSGTIRVVPEPGGIGVLALSTTGILLIRRKRRRV